jgi:hypothetical protein
MLNRNGSPVFQLIKGNYEARIAGGHTSSSQHKLWDHAATNIQITKRAT